MKRAIFWGIVMMAIGGVIFLVLSGGQERKEWKGDPDMMNQERELVLEELEGLSKEDMRNEEWRQAVMTVEGWGDGKEGRYSEAVDKFTKVIGIDPDSPHGVEARFYRAIVYHHMKLFRQALADITVAIENHAVMKQHLDNPVKALADSHLLRAELYLELREYDKAVEDCDRVIELMPDRPEAYYFRGEAYGLLGNMEGAVSDFLMTVELYPDSEYAANARKYLKDLQ